MSESACDIVRKVIELAVDHRLDWEPELRGPEPWTARQVVNAVGRAATKAGVPNNLVRGEA